MRGHRLNFGANNNRCHNLVQIAVSARGREVKLSRKKSYYQKTTLRFQCTGCGKCCYGDPNTHYISITDREAARIQRHLKISQEKFVQTYTETLPWGGIGIQLKPDGACPFLLDEQCQIYQQRPAQCRSYPFWSEVVESRSGWQVEAQRCEGMNRGEIVPLVQIERRLKQCAD